MFEDVLDNQKQMKKPKQQSRPQKIDENPNEPSTEQIIKAYETVYLIKWLFPDTAVQHYRQRLHDMKQGRYPKF